MKSSFNVPKDLFKETKRLVHINNLYFVCNPFKLWSCYQFYIEGDVLDHNNFMREFDELLRHVNREN